MIIIYLQRQYLLFVLHDLKIYYSNIILSLLQFGKIFKKPIKNLVYSELKSFACIYLIINLVNGKMYVGSGTVGRIPMRFHKHLFSSKGSKLVWNAVKIYSLDNFAFLILEK